MIEYQKIALRCSPTDVLPEHCDERRFTSFVTEDTGTGDVTVPVILERASNVLLAVIISLGVIILAHAALSMIVGEWV